LGGGQPPAEVGAPQKETLYQEMVYQPPYSPELNPAERVFEEVRWWVEGRRSEEGGGGGVLRRLEAEGKVLSLVGWRYIRQALNALPS
jgi:transposase